MLCRCVGLHAEANRRWDHFRSSLRTVSLGVPGLVLPCPCPRTPHQLCPESDPGTRSLLSIPSPHLSNTHRWLSPRVHYMSPRWVSWPRDAHFFVNLQPSPGSGPKPTTSSRPAAFTQKACAKPSSPGSLLPSWAARVSCTIWLSLPQSLSYPNRSERLPPSELPQSLKSSGCDFFLGLWRLRHMSTTVAHNSSIAAASGSPADERASEQPALFPATFQRKLRIPSCTCGQTSKELFSHLLWLHTSQFQRKDQSWGHRAGQGSCHVLVRETEFQGKSGAKQTKKECCPHHLLSWIWTALA